MTLNSNSLFQIAFLNRKNLELNESSILVNIAKLWLSSVKAAEGSEQLCNNTTFLKTL